MGPGPESGTGPEPGPDSGTGTGTGTGLGPESGPGTGPGPKSGTGPGPDSGTGTGPESGPGTGTGTGPGPELGPGTGPGPETGMGPESGPGPKSETGPGTGPESGPGPVRGCSNVDVQNRDVFEHNFIDQDQKQERDKNQEQNQDQEQEWDQNQDQGQDQNQEQEQDQDQNQDQGQGQDQKQERGQNQDQDQNQEQEQDQNQDQDQSEKKLAAEPDYTDVSLTAAERVRALGKMGCSVEINEDIAPRRYFRSGVEMERMAAVYLEEGSLENAYVLYTKFITLFVEKLPSHRDYQHCSIPEKQLIMKKLQEVAFPCKDELKKRLQEKYSREHTEYLRAQSQSVVVDGCGQQLQRLSLLDEDRRRFLEGERQRVAALRRMQIESEQFRYFEEQLRRQELANRRGEEVEQKVETKVPAVTDGSCLSQKLIRDGVGSQGADPNRNRPAPISQPAATLAGVHTQRVEGLRRVVIPRDLTYRFLLLADSNTARGIETCGVLCGRLTHNEFVLTHVVIPKQSAGPDFCDMENVEELFSFQDQQNLLTLGWIHVQLHAKHALNTR
ncbi:hypothetical protein F2P81_022851 [Scophthalmus maximus]|uniref:MPN domain-containing protein n=1 Tax=Scophthalmus maximus TaxID=52904 RepID=A0A6A4S2T2_SCOMX|nr:hypothetical protein F2P81_022851 [Scophthalmus maximus]